ncbi:MAG: M20/M25/M40 family metallo-hydrolase, partial [Clostridiales bacterium]|jgi:tripeptide aminopeptidase|nr:M20/M25/M40 family metallo-hydrolase [Clostridiales bacterium]
MGDDNKTAWGRAIPFRERIIRDFSAIVGIDSPSLGEREMAGLLKKMLEADGFSVAEDGAAAPAGGVCGNLIASLAGDAALPAVALLAHMDTVGPCAGKKCVVDGDLLRSDGTTILGGDDAAGIVIALETARRVREAGIRHGDILIILTIAEEIGLIGAKHLDWDLVRAATQSGGLPRFCFVFDSSMPVGAVVAKAPTHKNVRITVTGRAAHAGIEPERGISAIAALAEAIGAMPLGRIDIETTANIGKIEGGSAQNVVCGKATAWGEARSIDPKKLAAQLSQMRACLDAACKRRGAVFEFEEDLRYEGFTLDPDCDILRLLDRAARLCLKKPLELRATGGGSDANVLNGIGIPTANLPAGMHAVHSTEEYADLREIDGVTELMVQVFRELAGGN